MDSIKKLIINGVEYDITTQLEGDIEDLREDLEDVENLVGSGVIE